jgi:hypothetical protein
VQVAPLVVRTCGYDSAPVYRLDRARFASDREADLIVIDGPPGVLGGRRGMLHQALDFAAADAVVVLDDADRSSERAALDEWSEQFGSAIRIERLAGFERGLAVIHVRRPVRQEEFHQLQASHVGQVIRGLQLRAPCGLADEEQIRALIAPPLELRPFPEHGGQFAGVPATSAEAIEGLQHLVAQGGTHLAIAWPASWWLDHYVEFARFLSTHSRCVHRDRRVAIFDLAQMAL